MQSVDCSMRECAFHTSAGYAHRRRTTLIRVPAAARTTFFTNVTLWLVPVFVSHSAHLTAHSAIVARCLCRFSLVPSPRSSPFLTMAEPSAGAGTGELNVQSVDLTECKELNQPVPLQATLCRKGVYAILKDCPCKVSHATAPLSHTELVASRLPPQTELMAMRRKGGFISCRVKPSPASSSSFHQRYDVSVDAHTSIPHFARLKSSHLHHSARQYHSSIISLSPHHDSHSTPSLASGLFSHRLTHSALPMPVHSFVALHPRAVICVGCRPQDLQDR